MAEPVVSFVVERLGDLLINEAKFLHGVNEQVVQIRNELRWMQSFLKDADARQNEGERVRIWVGEIKEISYDAEDVIETFIFEVASRRGGGIRIILKRYTCIFSKAIARHKVGVEIQALRTKISELTRSLQTYGIKEGEGSSSTSAASERHRLLRRSYSHVVDDDVVGLLEDVKKLVEQLVNEDRDYCPRVVSVCGMGGLGKTTIAKKVYHHKDVRHHFDDFAWVCVSQQWKAQDILRGILKKLIPEIKSGEIMKMEDDELFKQVHQVQKEKKCLVVLDDIWSMDAWNCLRPAFPNNKEKTGSKILLTTRNKDVALHVDPNGFLHQLPFLNEEESWDLLQKKSCLKRDGTDSIPVDTEMERVGRELVRKCGGLPLAVVVLGGVLVTKHTLHEWELVNQNVSSHLRKGKVGQDQQYYGGVSEILALSYLDLPYQFKPSFLYLSNFPEDSEISIEKLCQQWVAEDLVSFEEAQEEETWTDVAERFLHELSHRCMVQLQVKESSGRIKSCRLHDLMRDFCLSKAKEENFLKVIDFRHGNDHHEQLVLEATTSSSSSTLTMNRIRRMAFYLNPKVDKFVLQETGQRLRSALFFTPYGHIDQFMPKMKSFFIHFKLLRVLDLGGSIGGSLPKAIGKLSQLRYLSLKGSCFKELPLSIGKLKYLQTLDLRVDYGLDSIPNVLWKMERLRHLYLPSLVDSRSMLNLNGLRNLEILVNFHIEICDIKDLLKLTNLRKLTASLEMLGLNDLGAIINYLTLPANHLRHSSFKVYDARFFSKQELTLLSRLLEFRHVYKLNLGGPIGKLPDDHHFNPNLTNLTLRQSELKEDPMATLEKVPNLRTLELSFNAFVGEEMVCSAMGFPRLRILCLWNLLNLENWRVDEGSMPNLSTLRIDGCRKLRMVPEGLRFVTSLQELIILNMPEEFRKRLQEDFYKVRHVPVIRFSDWQIKMN